MSGIEGVLNRIDSIISRVTSGPAVAGPVGDSGGFASMLEAAMEADASPAPAAEAAVEAAPADADAAVDVEADADADAGSEHHTQGLHALDQPVSQGVEYRKPDATYFTVGSILGTSEVRSVGHIVPASDFVMPVLGASTEGLWNSFGHPWGPHLHAGIDIFADEGTPIVAATSGWIEFADSAPVGGNRVWIRGDDGRGYYYAHLAAFAEGIHGGMYVDTGEIIGFVGHTGDAEGTPDHLHFAISRDNRKPGDSMDPAAAGWLDPGPFLGIGAAPAYANRAVGDEQ